MPLPAAFLPVLHHLYAALHGQDILWAITGSTGFALRDLPFTPKDIDLQTNASGAYTIEKALRQFVVRPVTFSGTDKIRSHFGQLRLDGIKVEIMGDVEKWVNGRWESPPNLMQHREFVTFDGLELPVLSLAYERQTYEQMGRMETAVILQQWLDIPTEFSTERLTLRRYRPEEDSAVYFQMLQANRDHLRDFMPPMMEAVQDEADAADVLRQLTGEWQQRNLFIFGIWEKESHSYVGEAYLANPDWHVPSIELGYFLVEDKTGHGYATEAAQAAVRFAFERLHVRRVELQCAADNQASQRVAERCGFTLEGRQRQRHRKKDGMLVDRLWYGLLLREWQEDGR